MEGASSIANERLDDNKRVGRHGSECTVCASMMVDVHVSV